MTLDERSENWINSDRTVEEEFGTWDEFFRFRELWRIEVGIIKPQKDLFEE